MPDTVGTGRDVTIRLTFEQHGVLLYLASAGRALVAENARLSELADSALDALTSYQRVVPDA